MPQIAQLLEDNWYLASQLFWLVVAFALIYVIVGRGMATKVQSTVEQRDRTVAEDLAGAEAARAAADQAEEQWRAQENAAREQAKRKLAEARSAGAKASETRLGAANAELDAKVGEAEARIAAAQQAALTEIGAVAADAARDIVRRVAETEVEEAEARTAVEKVLHG